MSRLWLINWMAILGLYATSFTDISAAYPVTPVNPECPKNQEINCQEIHTSEGFTYHAPEVKRKKDDDCEHGWYHQNKDFIEDSTGNGESPKSLTMSNCVNLQWQIICNTNPVIKCVTNISVSDQSKYTTNDSLARNNTFPDDKRDALWVIPIIVVVGGLILLFLLRKKKCCPHRFNLCRHNSVV